MINQTITQFQNDRTLNFRELTNDNGQYFNFGREMRIRARENEKLKIQNGESTFTLPHKSEENTRLNEFYNPKANEKRKRGRGFISTRDAGKPAGSF